MHRWRRSVLLAAVLVIVAAACGNNRSDKGATNTTAPGGGGATTTTASGSGPMFGDAPLPCGPAKSGETNTASDKGVTASQITIGTGDDAGYVQTPGLDKEMTEAVKDLAKLCNDAGGINGRKIVVNYYDAAILQVQQVTAKACADNIFMLVGEGWALDANQEETRVGCKLPAIPGYAVSAAFANGPMMYQGVPVPAQQVPGIAAEQIAKLQPEAIKKSATLAGNFSATQQSRDKIVAAYPKFGFKFLPKSNIEYPITGEADWTPTVKQLKATGATAVLWEGECQNLLKVLQAAKLNNYHPIWFTETNHYEQKCAASNDGSMDGLYIRMVFVPFEAKAKSKAVQDYLNMVSANGQHPTQLGMQASSSWLLWATAAQKCGANLTRDCVLNNIKNVHDWTGHGLHVKTDPGANQAPDCGLMLQMEGSGYKEVSPTTLGAFDCDPKSVVTVSTQWITQAKIGADGISHQFG